jgi:tRNA threonylcarbamoyladenosine biosynthesis protein TsaE
MPEGWANILGGQAISLSELTGAASELIRQCGAIKVWLFSGEMGVGKTTLIKAVCEQLGIHGGMSSPTFAIVNEYDRQDGEKIYHFDFYRLKVEQEAYDLGVEEYFDSGYFCFVEWPEKVPTLIPAKHVEIKISPADAMHRKIAYLCHD